MSLKMVKAQQEDISSKILKGLNPEQRQAVITTEGPLLVIAGAGSGKTRVLTHRIAYLLERGIPPYNILALTFTNKAANEMKNRIAGIVSNEAASKIWAGTFHSIFARILRGEATKLGYTSSFSIYDTDESLSLLRQVMNTMGINQQQFSPQSIRSQISSAKNQMMSWQDFSQTANSALEKQTAMIYAAYEQKLQENNAMDFDDLLLNMIHVLNYSQETLEKYQDLFKYLLVDEYQDTNKAQYIVIHLLANKHKNICVVGDDAQSIYRWRGADIRNILEFQKDYPDATVIRLEQNYRSTKVILGAADCVIKNNHKQLAKNLWTDNPEGDPIDLISCYDDREESQKIVEIIKNHIYEDKYKPKDFAVLYRTNAQSLALENAFRRANLPYIIVGGISFFKRKEIKDAIAYLKLLINPQDSESLLRVLNEPPRGLGQTSVRHLLNFAKDNSVPLLDAFARAHANDELQPRAKNAATEFAGFIVKYIRMRDQSSPAELIKTYISESGLLNMYKEIGTEDALDRLNNLNQFLFDIESSFASEPNLELVDYLQQISLLSDIDEKDTSKDQVKLMTLHSAKGLEFPVVIIAGLEHGLFPLQKAEMTRDEEEEERRLFYVGITRAERKLYLTYSQKRMRYGDIQQQAPSPFIHEIDKRFIRRKSNGFFVQPLQPVEKQAKQTKEKIIFDDIPHKDEYSQIPEQQTKTERSLRAGDLVQHGMFGLGRIERITGSGDTQQATVNFQSAGKKKLMIKYAKLKVVNR